MRIQNFSRIITIASVFFCTSLSMTNVLAKEVAFEYGSGPLKVKQVANYDDKRLDKDIKKYLKFLKVKKVERRSEGKLELVWTTGGELKNATREEKVMLMSCIMKKKSRGKEIDLLIPSKNGKIPASFYWDSADHIVVESGAPVAVTGPAPTVASLQKKYKLGAFKEEGAAWDDKALRSVELALQLLSKEERKLIEGIPFVRMPRGHGVHRAIYSRDTKRAQVEIYNHTFQLDDEVFIGSVSSPYPDSVGVLLHELGHAIADRRHRELIPQSTKLNKEYQALQESANAAVEKTNAIVDEFNAAKGNEQKKIGKKLKAAEKAMKAAKKKADLKYQAANAQIKERNDFDAFDTKAGGRPAEAAFASVVPLKESPTPYGKKQTSESFAECFRMYKADPEALSRAAPNALKWFKAGHHVRIAKTALRKK